MNRIIIIFAIAFALCGTISDVYAGPRFEMALNMGMLNPEDQKVRETFGANFQINGYLGFMAANGLEVRAGLGHYSDISHKDADIGTDLTLGITPLTGSIIYNIPFGLPIRPYIGGGIGAYFYDVEDNIYGELETDTKFGTHFLAGAKIDVAEGLFLDAIYQKQFLPKIFFDKSQNFNSWTFTVGIGFSVPINDRGIGQNNNEKVAYKYNKKEEEMLLEIQQLTTEINEIKQKRKQIEQHIDEFYSEKDYDENDPEFAKQYKKVQYLEKKVKRLDLEVSQAKDRLTSLNQQWDNMHTEKQPIEEQVVYLRHNYMYSPYGLYYRQGYIVRGDAPYSYHYYHNDSDNHNSSNSAVTAPTVEDKKEYAEKKKEYILNLKNR
ncbi:MAG: hypothetical protein DKM50_08400 [Candidatus Margulisiibacteriota bacterium]|nr:MAG: hypothetical protein A2X43_03180 [Candidatus Margulisbacteria bacterium GWD2_39_127]OGI05016.1 MAG: hypothetical protein A2X42_05445 [Candidatus Margulisbacteria bacterium GWF2_38_17]OGI09012.1 MAG: hypothetical protein A2X41_01640 [Candidatus Margulisbacteria bacterium GWE2_39_32]PZM79616.1 MAG: hypothetical protein DKM50_08400 [Candidatus Margulisiibacteriota bacterium]HAR63202.1 hypothetical protein [Candidatus Margulisiibacteriota bacterium]